MDVPAIACPNVGGRNSCRVVFWLPRSLKLCTVHLLYTHSRWNQPASWDPQRLTPCRFESISTLHAQVPTQHAYPQGRGEHGSTKKDFLITDNRHQSIQIIYTTRHGCGPRVMFTLFMTIYWRCLASCCALVAQAAGHLRGTKWAGLVDGGRQPTRWTQITLGFLSNSDAGAIQILLDLQFGPISSSLFAFNVANFVSLLFLPPQFWHTAPLLIYTCQFNINFAIFSYGILKQLDDLCYHFLSSFELFVRLPEPKSHVGWPIPAKSSFPLGCPRLQSFEKTSLTLLKTWKQAMA